MNDDELVVSWEADCIFRILLERCHLRCGCLMRFIAKTTSDVSMTLATILTLMRSPKIDKQLDVLEFWLASNLLREFDATELERLTIRLTDLWGHCNDSDLSTNGTRMLSLLLRFYQLGHVGTAISFHDILWFSGQQVFKRPAELKHLSAGTIRADILQRSREQVTSSDAVPMISFNNRALSKLNLPSIMQHILRYQDWASGIYIQTYTHAYIHITTVVGRHRNWGMNFSISIFYYHKNRSIISIIFVYVSIWRRKVSTLSGN